jgi:1-acyl-sn-glycerol-3-phosphate acyltransferase
VKPQAVWLQLVRLSASGLGPQLRRGWRVVRGVAFALWTWLLLVLAFAAIVATALVAPGRRTWSVAQRLARAFFGLAGIPVAVRGLENLPASGPYVIASNHTSYLDGVVLISILPWRDNAFVAKRELADYFISRTFIGGVGAVFVERFDVQKSAEHADELVGAVRGGRTLIVFPEGTLQRQAGLMAFRGGAFQTAAQAGVPVVPVALRGVRSVLRDETWYLRRAPISVTIGTPVAPQGSDWNGALKLRDEVRSQILRHCGEPDLDAGR